MIKQLLVKAHSLVFKGIRVFVLGIIAVVIITFIQNAIKVNSAQSKLTDAKTRLEKVKKEQLELKSELENVQSSFYKEKQARDVLGLAKKREIVLVLPDEETLRRLSPRRTEEQTEAIPAPNWKKWYNLFF